MDKHITDIELFELTNNLIADEIQRKGIEEHISICESCTVRFETEKSIDNVLLSNLAISETIDVSESIQHHFAAKPAVRLFDTNWIVYTILGLFGCLAIIQVKDISLIESIEGVNIPQMQYLKMIVFAVVGVLLVDLMMNFFKQKKQSITS